MKFKTLKVTEEGHCEKCGRPCPRRRVLVQPLDVDGNPDGDPQAWGVNCAAQVRFGSKSVARQNQIVTEAILEEQNRLYYELTKLARVAAIGRSYDFGGPATAVTCRGGLDGENLANRLYHRTGRRLVGSYFARNADGHVVRVDGSDGVDVEFYASRGFVRVSEPVKEDVA